MSEADIVTLKPYEHVRLRPGMYFGGTGTQTLHHLVYEVMDNAIEAALQGDCTHIWLTLYAANRVRVVDNSQGLSVSMTHIGRNALELIMTSVGVGYQHPPYSIQGGLHGAGLSAVTPLASECTAEVARDGFLWRQSYCEGVPQTPVEQVRPLSDGESTGTTITFTPDFTILEPNEFDYDRLAKRCRELSYLVPGLTLTLRDERNHTVREDIFFAPNGLADWIHVLNVGKKPLHEIVNIKEEHEVTFSFGQNQIFKLQVYAAFQFTDSPSHSELSYVNTVATTHKGTHVRGFHAGLKEAITTYRQSAARWKDIAPGLTAIIGVLHPFPSFDSMSKVRLINMEVTKIVQQVVNDALLNHPEALAAIVRKLEKTSPPK